ncbi:hypothetical protein [Thalassovita gelatinovora]|nr:hypothetical protein [Thalassovita gelatinovora]QIZ81496.1 hypothetical protein HFZ77_13910 [Thalassovita gelatinovora]
MDKTTEAIAFFIGLFQTVAEATSTRLDYSSFKFYRKQQPLDPLHEHSVQRDFIYGPEGYDPQVQDPGPFGFPAALLRLKPLHISPDASLQSDGIGNLGTGTAPYSSSYETDLDLPPIIVAPPPGATMQVTIQVNTLTDQDIIDMSPETAASFIQIQSETLAALQAQADHLQILPPLTPQLATSSETIGAAETASAMFTQILARSGAATEQTPHATVHLATGAATQGVTVDGQSATQMPNWQDLLPHALQSGQDDAQQDAVHARTTGGNLALNEAVSVGGGVDAAVIAVGGDVVSLDVISQVNVLRDDVAQPEASNQVVNAAGISGRPTQGATPETGVAGFVPDLLTLATIEGDLITYDWIHQINSIRDEDTVSFTTSGSESLISVGGNQTMNSDLTTMLGQAYDLIIVEGDMITQNVVTQTNILLDEDVLRPAPLGDETGPVFDPSTAETSGNALINSATITHTQTDQFSALSSEFRELLGDFDPESPDLSSVLTSALLAPMDIMNALYITGDLIQMREVSQTNVISDSDLIQSTEPENPGTVQTLSTGDNAAVNLASIVDFGLPSHVMSGGSVFSDAVLYQARLISDDAPPTNVMLAPDPATQLASEAVAFLTDFAATGPTGEMEHGVHPTTMSEDGPPHLDVMQTMLA